MDAIIALATGNSGIAYLFLIFTLLEYLKSATINTEKGSLATFESVRRSLSGINQNVYNISETTKLDYNPVGEFFYSILIFLPFYANFYFFVFLARHSKSMILNNNNTNNNFEKPSYGENEPLMLVDADEEEEEHENIAFQENINERNLDPTNTIKHSFTNNNKDLPQLFFPSEVIKSVFLLILLFCFFKLIYNFF